VGAVPQTTSEPSAPPRRIRLKEKVSVRLDEADLAALTRVSEASGTSAAEWVRYLIRAHLQRRPQFNRRDGQALIDIQTNLERIALNIRELRRRTEALDAPMEIIAEQTRMLDVLSGEARSELGRLREITVNAEAYWSAEP